MQLRSARSVVLVSLLLPLGIPAQNESVEDIFADLQDFSPPEAAAQPAQPPARPAAPSPDAPSGTDEPVMQTASTPAAQPAPPAPAPAFTSAAQTGTPSLQSAAPPADEALPARTTDDLLLDGREAYLAGQWNRAQELFEAALHRNPYSKDAIEWLRYIADRKNSRETRSYNTTRRRMLEGVQAAWNTPRAEGAAGETGGTARPPTEREQQAAALREQLSEILIPSLTFRDAGVQQAVTELSGLFKQHDPAGKGVNLVVYGTADVILPSITFSGSDLTALETLDIITQMSGMKYDIGPGLVTLTPVNYEPPQQMIAAEFDVLPSVGSKMMLRAGEDEPGRLVDARGFFSTVPFPPGSSAQYNPEFNMLLARNVPKHLDKVEELLKRYNEKALAELSRQVEIETKFIEVSQGALDELGFEWTLGEAGERLTTDTITMPGGQKLFTDTLRTGSEAFGSDIRPGGNPSGFNDYARAVTDPTGTGLIGTAGELLIQKVKGDLKMDLLIRALERQAGSDLLSAPKVLAKSGETATIHIGEVHWFPTQFDLEIEREAQPVLVPLDYEEEKTGVLLEVSPDLDPETGTITMRLAPEIRELAGYDQQHVATLWPFFNSGGTSANAFDITTEANDSIGIPDIKDLLSEPQAAADRLIARRPVFKTRKVETMVTIDDGSTIAMGGLIKEQLETFEDRVPLLGDIPLLGRLFRSEGERNVKRNLLIFVTAHQVDASGYKKSAE